MQAGFLIIFKAMAIFEPVAVTRLYRMISRQIADKIRSGEFAPGSRLPSERDLALSLRVSRTTVREALIALELEDYVEIRVGSGVFVTRTARDARNNKAPQGAHPAQSPALQDAEGNPDAPADMTPFELIGVHLLVEPESASLAAKYGTPAQLAAIHAANRDMGHSRAPTEQNRLFHVAIAEASGNAALLATIRYLWGMRNDSVIYQKLEGHFVAEKIWLLAEAEHDEVAQAIARRDHAAARRTMRDHFLAIRKRLRNDFKENALFQGDGAGTLPQDH